MNWEIFYLACFFVGLVFSVIGVLGGMLHLHLPVKFHLPDMHIGHRHPHLHVDHGMHLHKPSTGDLPFFNMATLVRRRRLSAHAATHPRELLRADDLCGWRPERLMDRLPVHAPADEA